MVGIRIISAVTAALAFLLAGTGASPQTAELPSGAAPTVRPAEPDITGTWTGIYSGVHVALHVRMEIRRDGEGFVGDAYSWTGMPAGEARLLSTDSLVPPEATGSYEPSAEARCVRQRWTIQRQGDKYVFRQAQLLCDTSTQRSFDGDDWWYEYVRQVPTTRGPHPFGDSWTPDPGSKGNEARVNILDERGRPLSVATQTRVYSGETVEDWRFVRLYDTAHFSPRVGKWRPASDPATRRWLASHYSDGLARVKLSDPDGPIVGGHVDGKLSFAARLATSDLFVGDGGASGLLARLRREGTQDSRLSFSLPKGKTVSLACLDGGTYHYTCYVPRSYRHDRPSPVLVNMSPSGNAKPLSPKMSEELGWLMVGLTEARNGPWPPVTNNREAVLWDLRRRLNVDWRRVYFSGLSGGARASVLAAISHPEECAGVLTIGAGGAGGGLSVNGIPWPKHVPRASNPLCFVSGETDYNRAEIELSYAHARKRGHRTVLFYHPGGHTWGRPGDHERALRWLAANS